MKLILSLCLLAFITASCNQKKMDSKELTNVAVVRDVTDPNETQEETPLRNDIEEKTEVVPQQQVKRTAPKYHIIVASFRHDEKNKADKMVKQLRAMDYQAIIIDLKGRFRISLANYPDKDTAEAERDKYREITDRQDIWILKTE